MKIVPKVLEKVDFISVGAKPTFNYKSSPKNCIGGCLSVILAAIVSAALFFYGREIIGRDSPTVRLFEEKMTDSKVKLSEYPIPFYFVLLGGGDATKHPLFSQTYRIEAVFSEINVDNQGNVVLEETIIPVESCTEADLYNSRDIFISYLPDIAVNQCLKLEKAKDREGNKVTKELYLNKAYGGINSKYLSFDVYSCNQAELACSTALKEIGVIFFGYSILDRVVNVSSFSSPLEAEISFESKEISLGFKTVSYASVQTSELVTDESWFIKSEVKRQWFTKGQVKSAVSEVRNNQVAQTIFDSPSVKRVYHRKYIKVQEILGITGGILKACSIIFSALCHFPSQHLIYTGLANLHQPNISRVPMSVAQSRTSNSVSRVIQDKREKKQTEVSLLSFILAYFSKKKALELKIDCKSALKYLDIVVLTKKINEIEANIKT